jgi:hypothetical protein
VLVNRIIPFPDEPFAAGRSRKGGLLVAAGVRESNGCGLQAEHPEEAPGNHDKVVVFKALRCLILKTGGEPNLKSIDRDFAVADDLDSAEGAAAQKSQECVYDAEKLATVIAGDGGPLQRAYPTFRISLVDEGVLGRAHLTTDDSGAELGTGD